MPAISYVIHTPGFFVMSQANGTYSRDPVTIATAAGSLFAGTVLGKLSSGGKYVAHNPGATDGSLTAAGILWADCDATAGDQDAIAVVRAAEVRVERLFWGPQVTTDEHKSAAAADLEAVGIIFR